MKNIVGKCILVLLISVSFFYSAVGEQNNMKEDNWQLSVQAWTFHSFTLFETIDKAASLGLKGVELFTGQPLSSELKDIKFEPGMPAEYRKVVQDKLNEYGIKITGIGIVGMKNDEAECRKIFDFAKAMGVEVIGAEPEDDAMDLVDKLCKEYKIKVGIHNHPKPSHYWSPETVLKACKGRSDYIGALADTGHWMRSGVNPVEALKQLKGKIIGVHLKDLNEFGKNEAHDVVWGTGKANLDLVLAELASQNFKGAVAIEYEYNWDNQMPELVPSVAYFRKKAFELGQSKWQYLLDADLSKWNFKPASWTNELGVLTRNGGGDIWSKDKYGDYVLDLEYKVSPGANSGVFLRCGDLSDWIHTTIEIQIHDTTDGTPHGMCGAVYDCLSPTKAAQKKAGEWNHYVITCKANKIDVLLNGEHIIDMDLNKWTQAGKNPDGTPNKFKYAYKDMPRTGLIGLQDHGSPLWFRNVRIYKLDDAK